MPVPKKRLGHSDQMHRRANWKAFVPTVAKCTQCGAPKHPHTLCGACGYYKGRPVVGLASTGTSTAHTHDHHHDHDHDHHDHDHD